MATDTYPKIECPDRASAGPAAYPKIVVSCFQTRLASSQHRVRSPDSGFAGGMGVMSASLVSLDRINSYNASIPFNAWMGVQIIAATDSSVDLRVPWRHEFTGAPGMTHGGVLGSLIDTASYIVLMAAFGSAGPTVDMRVDFHRSTAQGPLYVHGELVRAGATISSVDVRVVDKDRHLIASGRCVYLSQSRRSRPLGDEDAV